MITADEIKAATDDVRWVMQNLPIEFILSDEMPVDRLMHALGVLQQIGVEARNA